MMSMSAAPEFRGERPDAGLFDLTNWPVVYVRFPELD